MPALTAGFALAMAMWMVWLAAHAVALCIQGSTAAVGLVGGLALAALLVGSAGVGRIAGRPAGSLIGAAAGLVAGVLSLLLLGSKVVVQPAATANMAHAANRLRPDAPFVVIGFLGVCTATALIGAIVGARTAPRDRLGPSPAWWHAALGVTATLSMLPLLVLGGFVTGTGSGLAVPDGITSYGAFSALFPISLMNEPRIFLEHAHRLFGTLVGLNTLALMLVTMAWAPSGRWTALVSCLGLLAAAAGAMGAGHAGAISVPLSIALMGILGLGALGFTHAMLGRNRAAGATAGVFALVAIQGLLGIARVDQQLTWVAAFHGAFAQFVFATACMAAALLTPLAVNPPLPGPETSASSRSARTFAALAMIVTSIQIIFGALTRHFDSMHSLLTHAVFSLVVVTLAVILGFKARRSGPDPMGRALRRCGALVLIAVFAQFLLGWVALVATQVGGDARTVPTADQLATAHPIPVWEAIATTAHQTGGALLLGAVCLTLFWARRAARTTRTA